MAGVRNSSASLDGTETLSRGTLAILCSAFSPCSPLPEESMSMGGVVVPIDEQNMNLNSEQASDSQHANGEREHRDAVCNHSNDEEFIIRRSDSCDNEDYDDYQDRFRDPFPSPTHSRAGTPQQSCTPPVRSATPSIDNQKSWNDPFPTPDVFSQSRCGTPVISSMDYDNILNADFANLLKVIPAIPLVEECTVETVDEGCQIKTSPRNISCPLLDCMDIPDSSYKRVSSESNLLSALPIPSVHDIWVAFSAAAGPDGHGLGLDEDEYMDNEKRKRHQRKNKSGEYHNSQSINIMQDAKLREGLRLRTRDNLDHGRQYKHDNKDVNSNTISNTTRKSLSTDVKNIDNQRRGVAMTPPKRLAFHTLKAKTPRAVVNVAGEMILTPVRYAVRRSSQSAVKLVRNTQQRLRERRERRRLRRLERINNPPRSWWICIPADHPLKVAWDILTMIWAALGAYRTHVRIRDRVFEQSPLIILTEIWFTVDILLNFITEHKTRQGEVIRDGKAVWARYLTTWFIVDILSLIPWESIYVKPIVEKIKRRNIFQKTFFRSKAVIKVSRVLRGRHIKLFGKASKRSGVSLHKLVALVIRYLPKYLLFLRNMRGALVIRGLRAIHWLHNMYKKIWVKARNVRKSIVLRRATAIDDIDDDEDDDEDEEWDEDSDRDDDYGPQHDDRDFLSDAEPILYSPRRRSESNAQLRKRRCFT